MLCLMFRRPEEQINQKFSRHVMCKFTECGLRHMTTEIDEVPETKKE